MRKLLPLASLLLAAAAAPDLPAQAPAPAMPGEPRELRELTIAKVFAKDAWGRTATEPAWSPDGRRLAYLWRDAEGAALWTMDAATGASKPVLREAELARSGSRDGANGAGAAGGKAGGEPPAISEYVWSPKGDSWIVLAEGDLYLYTFAGRSLRRLTATEAEEEDPKVSPRGDRVAFVRGEDLYSIDLASGRERRLTTGGEENVTLHGKTDWVYWEELWNRDSTGFWWSPDGARIAYYSFDERPVGVYPIVDDLPKYPTVRWQKYPKAGEPNPEVRVGVLDLAGGGTVWMATGGAPGDYLPRVAWTPDGGRLAVQRLDRGQTRLDLLSCDPRSGSCEPLWTERQATWVNVGDDFAMLADGRFVWGSERDGWRRLYLHGADGKALRAISPEGWSVTSLDAVQPDGTVVYTAYATAGLGAAERHVLRSRLDRPGVEGFERLTAGRGTNAALVAPGTGYWVHTWTDADTPGRLRLLRPDGGEVAALPSAPATAADPAALPKWEHSTIPGPGGSRLPARLLKPAGFDPSRRYPVVIYHYGGPASQVVADRWSSRDAWHKWMALHGYAVFSLDNQASLFFDKRRGEDRLHRRFGELELAGQLAGVEYLKTLPWVDAERLGLWGWSGGGANTLYCLLNRPGVWRAGVAGAPVTDWTLYDSIWTERYLDRPQENPEGYRLSSPITRAADLKDHLLVVHGTADDNVHTQNTLHLIRKLTEAGRPFEDAFLPGQSHAVQGDAQVHFYERMAEFFDRTLNEVRVGDVEVRGE